MTEQILGRPDGVKVYGLTGGIASGKTTAGQFFADLGVPVVDADELARSLRAPGGRAHAKIQETFGTTDAKELRGLIFSDPSKKKSLEAILHPLIQEESEKRFLEQGMDVPYCIYEAALLVETGRHLLLDGLIVVDTPPTFQLERLMARDGMTEASARQAIAAQADPVVKRRAATHLIQNNGSLDELREQVGKIHSLLV